MTFKFSWIGILLVLISMPICSQAMMPASAKLDSSVQDQISTSFAELNLHAVVNQPLNNQSTLDTGFAHLIDGLSRFEAGQINGPDLDDQTLSLLAQAQQPHTLIISCMDSRTGLSIFDLPFGEAFEIRTAGGILDSVGIESVSFAVEHFPIQTLIVVGHERCGAVHKAQNSLVQDPKSLLSIINENIARYPELSKKSQPLANAYGVLNFVSQIPAVKNATGEGSANRLNLYVGLHSIGKRKVELFKWTKKTAVEEASHDTSTDLNSSQADIESLEKSSELID